MIQRREDFGILLKEHKLTGTGIEIGVQRGEFSKILLDTTELKKIILLDKWEKYEGYNDYANVSQRMQDYLYNLVKARFKGEDRITVIKADAATAHEGFFNDFFDFIYHDANHTYEFVKQQLEAWYPKLKKGGIMAGHDYFDGNYELLGIFGVKQAVDEFAAVHGLKIETTNEEEGKSWWFVK